MTWSSASSSLRMYAGDCRLSLLPSLPIYFLVSAMHHDGLQKKLHPLGLAALRVSLLRVYFGTIKLLLFELQHPKQIYCNTKKSISSNFLTSSKDTVSIRFNNSGAVLLMQSIPIYASHVVLFAVSLDKIIAMFTPQLLNNLVSESCCYCTMRSNATFKSCKTAIGMFF